MEKGERIHAEVAHYLTTGEKHLSGQVLAGLHMIPDPGPDLLVEHDIVPELPNGKSGIDIAKLRAAGVPLVGAIDLIHARGINKGTEDIEHIYDPPGTIEVIDWKSCRTMNNAKKGSDLLKTIQMAGYGKYIFETEPDAKFVRLSHGYFPQQGVPRKSTILVDRGQVEKSWEHSNRVASSIVDAAKETNPDLVEANTDACMSYGRECPAFKVCSARSSNVMSKFIAQVIPPENLTKMSILSSLKSKSNLPEPRANRSIFGQVEAAKEPEPGPLAASSSPGEVKDEVSRLRAEIARLEAQERAAKGPELLPPDAPESNPLLASKPQTDNIFTQSLALVAETKEVIAEMVEEAPAAPKKRGRKPKVKEPEPVAVPDPNPEDVEPAPAPVAPEPSQEDIDPIAIPVNFYVDATPDGVECESFWPLIDHLVEVMCKEAGVPDIRLSTDERFAFGRWKGVLANLIHSAPVDGGNYQLLHAQGDIALVVVETMRQIVRKTGGLFVMGAR
jgi:hypothetical protein